MDITELEAKMAAKIEAVDRLYDSRLADAETALVTAKEALDLKLQAGDKELLAHIEAQKTSVSAALQALKDVEGEKDKAQDKFEHTVDRRFHDVNEFRKALDDLGKLMATRRELESSETTGFERWQEIQKQLGDIRSRLDQGPEGLTAVQRSIDRRNAHLEGIGGSAKLLGGLIAAVGVIISVVVLFANNVIGAPAEPATPMPQLPQTTVTVPK